ncbi:protein kinase-like domain, concanavalin A-like lectin/glucanase domain protein [Tanacetum coccineum]
MGDENPIRTLGDYSKPSHEGYRITIKLLVRNNVVPLRSDTIRLAQNGCSFHGLLSEDPNQHLKDFLKLVDLLDLDGEIGKELACDRKTPQRYPDVPTTSRRIFIRSTDSRTIDQSADGKLRDHNAEESWALLVDLALYNNKSWNDPRDFTKPVKAISLPQDVPRKEGVKEQGKEENKVETDMEVDEVIEEEESEFETDEEIEEILKEEEDDEDGENFNLFPTMEELTHHEWLLKNPRPPWVKARIRAGSPNNIKISYMTGHLFKIHAYIDLESPINIMSRRQYNQIRTYRLRSRQKPSNPNKISNFVGRMRGLKVFIGSFAYECDFMMLEDTTSIIDHHHGVMVFGRPFIDEIGLVYNEEEGTVMFEPDDKKITFKMPHTMEIFKQKKLIGLSTDSIPSSAYEENFGHGRTHYYQSLLIGDVYKQNGGDRRGIRHLIRLEKEG